MDWTEISIAIAVKHIEEAAAIANMAVPYGISIEDYSDLEEAARDIAHIDLIDEELLQKNRDTAAIHVYIPPHENPNEAIAYLSERLESAGIAFNISNRQCKNEDWENNWKAYFHPLPVGERLLIQPVWEPPIDPQGRAVLLLEPGLAFGSGSHATTRLCMAALEKALPKKNAHTKTVLDVGCGSGILGITALLLGAKNTLCIDIDPLAIGSATENAARNGFAPPQIEIRQGDLVKDSTGKYDVVVSNIVADAIVSLANAIGDFLADGGVWISSGIVDTRREDVLQAFAAKRFRVMDETQEDGWVCFTVGQ